jgi:hypothetical protein
LPCPLKAALICGRANFFVQRSKPRNLYDKAAAGERISVADARGIAQQEHL